MYVNYIKFYLLGNYVTKAVVESKYVKTKLWVEFELNIFRFILYSRPSFQQKNPSFYRKR